MEGSIEPYISPQAARHLARQQKCILDAESLRPNLVVNAGRRTLAKMLRQGYNRHIASLQLGDCIKSANRPSLLDQGVISEIKTLAGVPAATFAIDQATETFIPAEARRFPADASDPWGSSGAVTIDGNGVTTLTDATVDFTAMGIQFSDQVTFNTPTLTPVCLAIRRILSATQLELHNPYGYTSGAVEYRIENAGTQYLCSKLITASTHFPAATYGPAVLVHEAAWLFNDGQAWNRVLFAANDDTSGVLIQPADAYGVEIGVRFELLVTI